jgi:hypothetical protein
MDPNGIERKVMGIVSWFRRIICCSLDNSMIGLVRRIFVNLGVHIGWMNLNNCQW